MNDHYPSRNETGLDSPEVAHNSERFGYFLTEEPAVIVDQWKSLHDRMSEETNENTAEPLWRDLSEVCGILGNELTELTQVHPRRAAELMAEIMRHEDEGFSRFAHMDMAILYLSGRNRELAGQLWSMFVEHSTEFLDESAQDMAGEVKHIAMKGDVRREMVGHPLAIEAPGTDRAAMAMFYMEHVSQYNTR